MQPPPGEQESRAISIAMAVAVFAVALAIAMPFGAMPAILVEFDAGVAAGAWSVVAVVAGLAAGSFILAASGQAVESPRVLYIGLALFAVAGVGAALAPTLSVLIASRIAQGIGGAVAVRLATGLASRSDASNVMRFGLTLVIAAGIGLGPTIGGLLEDVAGWQASFVAPGIVAVVAGILLARRAPTVHVDSTVSAAQAAASILAIGAGLAGLQLVVREPGSVPGLVLVAVAALATAGIVVLARKNPAGGVVDANQVPTGRLAFSLATATGGMLGLAFALPLLLAQYHGDEPADAAIRLLPGGLALVLAGLCGAVLSAKAGARIPLIVGGWVLLAATLTFHFTAVDWKPGPLSLLLVGAGLGFGLTLAGLVHALSTAPAAGSRVTLLTASLSTGAALGVAIVSGLLDGRASSETAIDGLFTGTAFAYSDALIASVAFTAISFFVAVFQPPATKRKEAEEVVVMSPRARPVGPATWAVKPRAKPNSDGR